MADYLDKVLYLYPKIQGVMYWYSKYDGSDWEDLYDGLEWNNSEIPKPTKEELDALDDSIVEAEISRRAKEQQELRELEEAKKDIGVLAGYSVYKSSNKSASLKDYLDYLKSLAV